MFQVGYFLTRNASCFPNRVAVIDGNEALTWAQLEQKSRRLASGLQALGLTKGKRIAVLWDNSLSWVLLWSASQYVGAVIVPIHPRASCKDMSYIINVTNCDAMFSSDAYIGIATKLANSCESLDHLVTESDLEELTRFEPISEVVDLCDNDEAIVLFTSGTTGHRKGIVRTQKMVRDHALVLAIENEDSSSHEVMLTTSSFDHTGGFLSLLKMFALSGTIVIQRKFNASEVLSAIEEHKVTQLFVIPPSVYMRLYCDGEAALKDLSSVKQVLLSGGRCSSECAEKLFALFRNAALRVSWGSSETCSVASMTITREMFKQDPELIKAVGTINALAELRIVDDNGRDVKNCSVGEAIVRSPMVFNNYIGWDCIKRKELFAGEWFKTGDLLRRDESGVLYFVDRKKDMIKTGGENVYSLEVERALLAHPATEECAVIGIADKCYGESVAAVIKLVFAQMLTKDEIVSHCKQYLSSYKKPRYIAIVDKLPLTDTGKIDKGAIKKNAEQIFRQEDVLEQN